MTELLDDIQIENTTKYYSLKAISLATFFGGPAVGGILVRQNFVNAGKIPEGAKALWIGIGATVLMFIGIFSIPESIINKIPSPVIPAIYTGIIYLIVNKFQGKLLENHERIQGHFYSGWRTAGISLLGAAVTVGLLFAFVYFGPEGYSNAAYEKGILEFQKNEEIALELYTLLETEGIYEVTTFIHEKGIPAWLENIQILEELNQIKDLDEALLKQNELLKEYCQLRIESYELIDQAISEDTSIYDTQIEKINQTIADLLEKL